VTNDPELDRPARFARINVRPAGQDLLPYLANCRNTAAIVDFCDMT
jgi:hypothetical protein